MNAFLKVTNLLLKNPMWASSITYIPRINSGSAVRTVYTDGESKTFLGVVRRINKNLYKDEQILPTDSSIVVDRQHFRCKTK